MHVLDPNPSPRMGFIPFHVPCPQNDEPEPAGAQQALGRLLGQALNLLGPQRSGGAAAAAETTGPPAEVVESEPEGSKVVVPGAAGSQHEFAKTANGTSGGGGGSGDDATVASTPVSSTTGLVGEKVKLFARGSAGTANGVAATDGAAAISASSSPAVAVVVDDGVLGPKTWSAPTAELVEANARLVEKAE